MSALAETLAELRARETDAAAALQRAREAATDAMVRMLDEGTEEARRARIAADRALDEAKAAYDEAHEAAWHASFRAARSAS